MTTNFIGIDPFVVAPGNSQAVGCREDQQDSFAFSNPGDTSFLLHGGLLAVVADGMGGLAHGAAASQIAVRTFLEQYESKLPDEPIPEALEHAVTAGDTAVFEFAKSAGMIRNVGSTLVATAITSAGLHWISVGDSALYLCRDAKLQRLNRMHILAVRLAQLVQRGELSAERARDDPDRDALTSYVGVGGIPEVDASMEPIPLMHGDMVILSTDGLYRALGLDEIASIAEPLSDGQQAADALLTKALERALPNQDNVTILCVKIFDLARRP